MFISAVEAYRELKNMVHVSDALDIISSASGTPYDKVLSMMNGISLDKSYYEEALEKIRQKMPVAYITGRKEFFGMEFDVTPSVLIPRPETEILTEAVLSEFGSREKLKILDLCTGSGCILLSLLKNIPFAEGVGVDISSAALEVARRNSAKFSLNNRATFIQADIRKDFYLDSDIDIITINPPYLSESEYAGSASSLLFEPRSALVASDNGLEFYNLLLFTLLKSGNNKPCVFCEIGYSQAEEVKKLCGDAGYCAVTINDLANVSRVLKIVKTEPNIG